MAFYLCYQYKVNKNINKFLLTRDKFMSEMQLKQTGFTDSACGPFTKNKESKSQKVMQTGDTWIKH